MLMAEGKTRAELTLALCLIAPPTDGSLLVAFESPLTTGQANVAVSLFDFQCARTWDSDQPVRDLMP